MLACLAIGLAGGQAALQAQDNNSLRSLAGRWSGECSYQLGTWWELRTFYRIVRPLDSDSLEILQWVEGGTSPGHPKIDLVLHPPVRFVVSRNTGLTFGSKTPERTIAFSEERGALVMKLTDTEESETCFLKSLIDSLEKDAVFGASRPSFDCGKSSQPREKAICSSSELSLLDQHLALSFRAADYRLADLRQDSRKRMAGQKLRASQEEWYSTHLKACQDAACVGPLYRERIHYLDALE